MDHYQTLGVAKNATPDEIKKAYRKLAAQHHPDRGGDTAQFQKIQQAYDILSDPAKRAQHDNPHAHNMHGFPGGFQFHAHGFNIDEIFGQMFGQQGHQGFHRQNFRTQVAVTLDEAYNGKSHILQLQTPQGPKVVTLEIPKGIHHGQQLRYDNVLDNATLIVEYVIIPNLKFERQGDDLYSQHTVSVFDLIVGGTFEFKTISGKTLEVNIQSKTQPHMHLKIPNQGMPKMNSGQYGDQFIVLKTFIPDRIDDEVIQSILSYKNKGNTN